MSDTAPPPRAWKAAFALGLLALFAGVSVRYSLKVMDNRSAFKRWQPQLLALEKGEDISERYAYPNPPIMAVLLLPLAKLPPLPAALAWFYLKAGMALLALRWVFGLVADAGHPFPPGAKALTVLLSLRPILGDLDHGNVNLFILFLVVGALAAYRRGRDYLAGLVLALAAACKVTPALFLPYFLWKREWRVLAGAAAGLALFLWPGPVPSLYLGFQENQRQLVSWYREMVEPFVVGGKVTSEYANQSLPGVVYRLATPSPSYSTFVDDRYTPTRYDNIAALTPGQARWALKGCVALFALTAAAACRTPTRPRQGWRLAAEFSLVVLGMLLFSERTWKHHCVTLVLPFAVLCYYLSACRPGPALRRGLVAALALAAALMASTGTALGEEFARRAQVYGAYVAAYLVLAAAMTALLLRREAPAAAEAAERRAA
jgi:hypothetical protein